MAEDLKRLLAILTNAVNTIAEVCEQRKEDFPRLDQPAQPSEYDPKGIRNDPAVVNAIKLGLAAAAQLQVTLQSPARSMTEIAARVNGFVTFVFLCAV